MEIKPAPAQLDSSFSDLLELLAQDIPATQQALNTAWLEDMAEFQPIWNEARRSGLESLARAIAPRRATFQEISAEASLLVRQSRETQASLRVSPLGVAAWRRYRASAFSTCRLRFSVRQSPMQPRDSGKNKIIMKPGA